MRSPRARSIVSLHSIGRIPLITGEHVLSFISDRRRHGVSAHLESRNGATDHGSGSDGADALPNQQPLDTHRSRICDASKHGQWDYIAEQEHVLLRLIVSVVRT